MYCSQHFKNLIPSFLEKQLKTERQIHSGFNNLHEISRVEFISVLWLLSFCIIRLSTQFYGGLFRHSSDLGSKVAAPKSKCLDIGGNCMTF